ncbi:MAG TPA: hypothetical protein VN696_18215, partial [Pyrinomonadaceae bacterium]|nr:hypothetical protein [Pyrinomonadaceae bacterium]
MSRCVVFVAVVITASFAASSIYSQDCPLVSVACPDATNDRTATFTANVMSGTDYEPTYKWTVSGGRIARGQGTGAIEVQVAKTSTDVTASVAITNFPNPCNNTASCSVRVVSRKYPKEWWYWVNDPKKPDWEILPQEAKPGEVILSKRNELGLLSNFAATPFVFHGKRYASLEGFWQAMLYPEGPNDPRAKFPGLEWKYTRAQVTQMTAFEAKHAGDLAEENMRKMKIGWVSFEGKHFGYRPTRPGRHYRLIVAAMWAKVLQND